MTPRLRLSRLRRFCCAERFRLSDGAASHLFKARLRLAAIQLKDLWPASEII